MMKFRKICLPMMLLVLMMCGLMLNGEIGTAETDITAFYLGSDENTEIKTESAVNDYAGIYTEEEIASFEEKMKTMLEEYDCNVVAFIIDNDEWASSEVSAPDGAAEAFLQKKPHKSTVVLWLNICRENRSLYVQGYGTAENKIMNSEADDIAVSLQNYVKKQHSGAYYDNALYVDMMEEFITEADKEMRRPYFFLAWWFHLALGVAVGAIVVFTLIRNSGGKMTADGTTYMNKGFSELIGRRDTYTHTTYVRTRKSSSSGGGGGGGHSSGGGRF